MPQVVDPAARCAATTSPSPVDRWFRLSYCCSTDTAVTTTLSSRSTCDGLESDVEHEQGHSGTRAAQIVGITYRQLDYWARTDLVRPSLADASGSGSRRKYSYRDLLELRMIKNLLDAGIRLETVREVFNNVRTYVG